MAEFGFRLNPLPDPLVVTLCFCGAFVFQGKAVFPIIQADCNRGIVVLHITNICEFVARPDVGLRRPADEHAGALQRQVNIVESQLI